MADLGLDVDEATLLKAYRLESLEPAAFQDVDHADDDSPATAGVTANDEPDPLGLHSRIATRHMPKDLRAQVSVSSKAFDPKVFLSTIHPDATFADLSRGLEQLKDNIEQRSQALKVLVEDNFDRFVAVKATTDGVYREMSETGPLRPDADYGVQEIKSILSQASARADQVFTPVLENNLKALKLRSTLGVFERSKFFFNLPGSLAESIDAGKYDAALRDYNKGKYLLEHRPAQLLSFNSTATHGAELGPQAAERQRQQQQQQQRVFRKVWDAVEATMKEMERKLFAALQEPRRPVDEQEKTIEVLLELSPKQDPVAVFLESQHRHIHTLMQSSYQASESKVVSARTMNNLVRRSEKDCARDIQSCLRQVGRGDPSFDRSFGAPTWRAIHHLVRVVSENLLQTLPSFWKVCKSQTEGKFSKSTSPGIQTRARAWATESIESYVRHLSSFFNLTDVAILARKALSPLPAWVPLGTCSMTAAHYMHLVLQDLSETVSTLTSLEIGQTAEMLTAFVSNARFAFTEVLCNLWQSDAKVFHMLEDWTINPDEQSTTLFLKDLSAFHRSNARAAYHIASGRDRDPFESSRSRDTGVTRDFTSRIKAAFLDAIYAFLDGIVHLAFSEYDPLDPTISTSHKVVGNSRLTVDVQELDTRILLSVTNLAHLNRIAIPTMAKQFQEVYHCKMSEDLATIEEVASQLDKILFDDFLKRKSDVVSSVFRNGILHSGVDWARLPKPSGVHPFIYEALLALVQVHAQVQSVAKSLINRTITSLLENLTDVILDSFRQIPRFGMGGMLQATLEIEYVHQTLNSFVSSKAEATLRQIYDVISQKYQQRRTASEAGAGSAADEAAVLQRELQEVKKTLVASRKTTALEFLCFRKSTAGGGSSSASKSKRSVTPQPGDPPVPSTTTTTRSATSASSRHAGS
ncbi:unnamed protein product [Parajaminaea phylloscopi]